jgi:hypothetical protein
LTLGFANGGIAAEGVLGPVGCQKAGSTCWSASKVNVRDAGLWLANCRASDSLSWLGSRLSRKLRSISTDGTNGIYKPVLNVFKIFSWMEGNRLRVDSAASVPLDDLIKSGVRESLMSQPLPHDPAIASPSLPGIFMMT